MAREVTRDNRGYADTAQDLLLTEEAARMLRISPDTLKDWRINGTGPKCIRLGYKLVRYRRTDVEDWLALQTEGGNHA